MAQCPWSVIDDVPISGKDAARFTTRCARDLRRHLGHAETWNSLISEVITLSQSIIDLSDLVEQPSKNESSRNRSLNKDSPSVDSPVPACKHQTFSRIKVKGTAQLHPCFLGDPAKGVRAFLTNFLLKYVPEFEGIWLAYHPNIVASESLGFVSEAEQFAILVFEIELHCLVFRPKPGSVVAGIVQSIRPTHIVLLIYGLFNGSIHKGCLDRRYEFKNGIYVARDGKSAKIELGSLLAFKVFRYHQSQTGELISMEGSAHDSRCCGVLDPITLKLI